MATTPSRLPLAKKESFRQAMDLMAKWQRESWQKAWDLNALKQQPMSRYIRRESIDRGWRTPYNHLLLMRLQRQVDRLITNILGLIAFDRQCQIAVVRLKLGFPQDAMDLIQRRLVEVAQNQTELEERPAEYLEARQLLDQLTQDLEKFNQEREAAKQAFLARYR